MFGLHGLTNTAKEPDLNTNGGLMYYQYTGLHTVSEITDRHGDIIEKYRYDAYGNIVTGITAPYNTTGYTGHTYDDKSGLIDMNARWYNPSTGRFMQEDTYQGTLTQPLTQNRYSYVLNNPINLWDPTGYAAEEGTGGGVGGGTTDWVPASYHIEEWENLDYRIVSEWFIDYSKYEIHVDDWVLTEREFTRDTVYSTWTREVEEIFGYLKKVRTFEKKSDEYTGHSWEILKDTSYYEETYSITSVYEWYDDVPRRLFNLYDYEHPPENLDSLTPKYTVNKKLGTSIILAGDEKAASDGVLGKVIKSYSHGFQYRNLDNLTFGLYGMTNDPRDWGYTEEYSTSFILGGMTADVLGVVEGLFGMLAGFGIGAGGTIGSAGTLSVVSVGTGTIVAGYGYGVAGTSLGNLGKDTKALADDLYIKAKGNGKGSEGAAKTTRETLLDSVSNQKLKNAIDQIYRPGAKTGDGGLADAIRHELNTGELVGGKSHIIKGNERVKNIENIIKSQDLNPSDIQTAQRLLNDLKNALGGK